MPPRQFFLVSYDISNDRRRQKTARVLQDFGQRVQYSVFECCLLPAELARLKERLRPLVHPPSDSIRFYALCAADVDRTQVMGSGQVSRDPAVYMI